MDKHVKKGLIITILSQIQIILIGLTVLTRNKIAKAIMVILAFVIVILAGNQIKEAINEDGK